MAGGTARAVGGFLDKVSGGGGQAGGVVVEVGEEEAAIDLSVAVEYGRPIPQISEAVRRSVIDRVENLISLRVTEVNHQRRLEPRRYSVLGTLGSGQPRY
jgi:uncharacterized alkaline shock family protein YloU